jgi:hypothetical protein
LTVEEASFESSEQWHLEWSPRTPDTVFIAISHLQENSAPCLFLSRSSRFTTIIPPATIEGEAWRYHYRLPMPTTYAALSAEIASQFSSTVFFRPSHAIRRRSAPATRQSAADSRQFVEHRHAHRKRPLIAIPLQLSTRRPSATVSSARLPRRSLLPIGRRYGYRQRSVAIF